MPKKPKFDPEISLGRCIPLRLAHTLCNSKTQEIINMRDWGRYKKKNVARTCDTAKARDRNPIWIKLPNAAVVNYWLVGNPDALLEANSI